LNIFPVAGRIRILLFLFRGQIRQYAPDPKHYIKNLRFWLQGGTRENAHGEDDAEASHLKIYFLKKCEIFLSALVYSKVPVPNITKRLSTRVETKMHFFNFRDYVKMGQFSRNFTKFRFANISVFAKISRKFRERFRENETSHKV
jgi:hypothetical protein